MGDIAGRTADHHRRQDCERQRVDPHDEHVTYRGEGKAYSRSRSDFMPAALDTLNRDDRIEKLVVRKRSPSLQKKCSKNRSSLDRAFTDIISKPTWDAHYRETGSLLIAKVSL